MSPEVPGMSPTESGARVSQTRTLRRQVTKTETKTGTSVQEVTETEKIKIDPLKGQVTKTETKTDPMSASSLEPMSL